MNDEEIAKYKAEMEAGARAFGGEPVTEQRLQEMRRNLFGDSPHHKSILRATALS